jgi:hypothetical protein
MGVLAGKSDSDEEIFAAVEALDPSPPTAFAPSRGRGRGRGQGGGSAGEYPHSVPH